MKNWPLVDFESLISSIKRFKGRVKHWVKFQQISEPSLFCLRNKRAELLFNHPLLRAFRAAVAQWVE